MGSDVSQRPPRSRVSRVFRSVRFKIVLLLLVPLLSLSLLWAFAATITLNADLNMLHVKTVEDHFGYPAGGLGSALQQERRLSLAFLGSKSEGDRAAMESGRLVTDRQADLFRSLVADKNAQKAANIQAKRWASEVITHLDGLRAKRQAIDSRSVSRTQAFKDYTQMVGATVSLRGSLSPLSDPGVSKDSRTQVALARAREVLSEEDGLMAGALASGQLAFTEHAEFTKLVGTRRTLYGDVASELRSEDEAYYSKIIDTPQYARLESLEDGFTLHMPRHKVKAGEDVVWKTTASSALTRLRGLELSSAASSEQRVKPIASSIKTRLVLALALGPAAVILTLAVSLWVARSVVHDLTGLRRSALDLANVRLPAVIRRLRRGENVDVAAEVPSLSFGTEEIDQVGQAFNAAGHTAIQGAVEEATLRRSISEVFLNLARRNQALLHRQLSLLDSMERRVAEPDELEDLFRLDHLATRMRRHAEGLIILSGQAPGRGWRNPVPTVDVARAAAAEVEDYARVTVATMPRVAIAGPSVADIIHLLAELIENATLFSPPDTTVQVGGQIVAHGFAFEVEDRGLSMDPASLARANERLASPPEFDLSNSAQLGLFVVGRLAQRHSIQVTLRASPYGGTTAIVLLPEGIVVRRDDQPELESGRPAMTRRGEEALVPVGVIGPPAHPNGNSDTGPVPLTHGDPPSLPQRRNDAAPQAGYDRSSYNGATGPYDSGANSHDSSPNSYDSGAGAYDSGAGSYGSGARPYDSGTGAYESGASAGIGQWAAPAPEETGEHPPLPRRRADPVAEAPSLPQRRSVFEPSEEPEAPEKPAAKNGKPALPRRVRQANLAPQLREESEPVNNATSSERSPEELRTMLSSIQKGWLRGRSDPGPTATHHEEEDI